MVRGKLPVRSVSKSLVTRLLENPQLPAYIPTLSGPALIRLVKHIGKEDAQDLLTYATPEQIGDLIEVDTWTSTEPGTEETFAPEKLLEWIELWADQGAKILASRLIDLGSQLLAMALNQYVVVVDIQEVGVSGSTECFGHLGVMPSDEECWPEILHIIRQVWVEEPEFLEEALACCCLRRSLVAEKTHITANENLAPDVAGERDRRRRERGYVTPASAAAFLNRIKSETLQTLILETTLDPASAMQLRSKDSPTGDGVRDVYAGPDQSHRQPTERDFDIDRMEIETLLEPVLTAQNPLQTLRLGGPQTAGELYLDQCLRELALFNQDATNARCNELVYLSNILMEGCGLHGKPMKEAEAMQCAYRTCNLGLAYCVFDVPWDDEPAIVSEFLAQEPGLVRAFNIGYRLILNYPPRIHAALKRLLSADAVQRKLQKDPWLRQAINGALSNLPGGAGTTQSDAWLGKLLEYLAIVGDASVCEQIRIAGDALPRLPHSLLADRERGLYIDKTWRFISTPDDLQLLDAFLDGLEMSLFR